ncbi:hypothetical protein [Lentzea californiensis]|uniref:hypothetical protein n=1 Tax=Lentzea californiensis TaxID=438851 RepID=UPI0021651970|nr:hypothetical protein [Lentzea californiensis]MCR3753934.1 hypothetical protein [Lentzea californiensis]
MRRLTSWPWALRLLCLVVAQLGGSYLLKDGLDLVVKFAIWYRKLVPEDIDVIFGDDGYNFDGVVTLDSTEEGLVEMAR